MPDTSTAVDLGFAALADPVRRAIIAHLKEALPALRGETGTQIVPDEGSR